MAGNDCSEGDQVNTQVKVEAEFVGLCEECLNGGRRKGRDARQCGELFDLWVCCLGVCRSDCARRKTQVWQGQRGDRKECDDREKNRGVSWSSKGKATVEERKAEILQVSGIARQREMDDHIEKCDLGEQQRRRQGMRGSKETTVCRS